MLQCRLSFVTGASEGGRRSMSGYGMVIEIRPHLKTNNIVDSLILIMLIIRFIDKTLFSKWRVFLGYPAQH